MIEVHNLSKIYGDKAAVRDVSFRIGAGEIVGFLGPNGAGKTTTIRMLTGYMPPTSGAASVAGFDVFSQGNDVRTRLGYLPENVPLYPDMRVEEFLKFRASQKRVPGASRSSRIDFVVDRCGLTDVRKRVIGTLSRGYRQRVGLADALVADPPVLILDEPTSGFDPLQRVELRQLILSMGAEGKTTILFSSHILSEVQAVSQRLLVIAGGRLVADGRTDELIRKYGEASIVVEAEAKAEELQSMLATVPGVRSVEPMDSRPGYSPAAAGVVRCAVHAEPGSDPRAAIIELCAKRSVRLREVAYHPAPLELVFARMVTGGEGAAVERVSSELKAEGAMA